MHLTSSERRSTSADPQSGMERKSHLVLRRSSGWLTPPLPEPDERGTSLLSSFSSSCLSTLSSVLTFPQHDERLGYIYVLLLFLFPAVCQTHLNFKKGMGIKWSKRVKIMGGKVIWREIVFPVLYDCRIILSLDVPRCYKAASKHLSHIGEWRSASQCFTLHHSCGKQSAGRDFYSYLFHLLSWHSS